MSYSETYPLSADLAPSGGAAECTDISLAVTPPFMRKIDSLAPKIGFAGAVVEVLDNANINVKVDGDLSPFADQGLVIAGDHSRHIEPLLVQAAMGKANRDASSVIAMPVSLVGRLMQGTQAGNDLIMPVIPTSWSSERELPSGDVRNRLRRFCHPEVLNQPESSLKRINSRAITAAARCAADGGAVTIFPTGGSDASQWRNGLGQVLQRVPEDARENVQVVGFRPESFSAKRVMASLLLRDMGIRPRQQTIALEIKPLGAAGELIATQPSCGREAAQAITDNVRAQYMSNFEVN